MDIYLTRDLRAFVMRLGFFFCLWRVDLRSSKWKILICIFTVGNSITCETWLIYPLTLTTIPSFEVVKIQLAAIQHP